MGMRSSRGGALLPLAMVALLAACCGGAPATEPPCARGCRCAPLAASDASELPGSIAANCSSPAAAAALGASPLGSRVRELRLTSHDDHLSVKEGAFLSLGSLRSLHLDHLALVKVYPGAFRGLNALLELDLSHNSLSAGDEVSRALRDLPQLRRLSLRGNNFGSVHGSAPVLVSRTIKFVDLGRCKLSNLPPATLQGLSHVRHIILDGNFMRSFKAGAFPKSVVSLDLSHNDIDRMSGKELDKLEALDAIELAGNPLNCDCDLLKISSDYNINKAIVCASPKQLMGKDLLKVKKHQLCGSHKKTKREAGNELDDESLSEEDDMPLEEDTPKDSDGESETDIEEYILNKDDDDDEVNDAKKETEDKPETKDDSALDNDQHQEKDKVSPGVNLESADDTNAENVENIDDVEDDSGPENFYGEGTSDQVNETEKSQDATADLHGDRIIANDDVDTDDEDESPEELLFTPDSKHVPDEEGINNESDKTIEDVNPVNENNKEKENTSPIVEDDTNDDEEANSNPVDEIDDDSESDTKNAAVDVDIDERDGNTFSSTNADKEAVNMAEGDKEENNEDDVDKVIPQTNENEEVESMPEEKNPPDSLPASQYTKLQAVIEKEEKNEGKSDEEEKDETEEPDKELHNEDNIPHDSQESTKTTHQTEEQIYISGAASVSEPVDETKEEIINQDDNLLSTVNNEDEEEQEEEEGSEALNKKEDTIAEDTELTEKSTVNSKEDALKADDMVEVIQDSENVVHSNDVGARIVDGSRVENDEVENDEVEDDEVENDEVEDDEDNAPVADILEEMSDSLEGNLEKSTADTEDTEEGTGDADAVETPNDSVEEDNTGTANEREGTEAELETGSEEVSPPLRPKAVAGESEDKEIENETLEKELEEDRIHSTLGHSDLGKEISNQDKDDATVDNKDEELDTIDDKNDEVDGIKLHVPLDDDDDDYDRENIDENSKDNGEKDQTVDEDKDTYNVHTIPEADKIIPVKEYEEIKEVGENNGSPGDKITLAAYNEESDDEEEEGSGDIVEAPIHVSTDEITDNQGPDEEWNEEEGDKESDNEAVPPLVNAESNEEDAFSGREMSAEKLDVSEENWEASEAPAIGDILDTDNSTEEGSGVGMVGRIPQEDGDEDEETATKGKDNGSGMFVPFASGSEEKKTATTWDEENEDEEGSGGGVYIPVVPGLDEKTSVDKSSEDNEGYDMADTLDSKHTSPPPIVEEDAIPRRKIPLHAAPPRAPVSKVDNTDILDKVDVESNRDIGEDIKGVGGGRAFLPDENIEDAVNPVAAPEDGVINIIEGVEEDVGKTKDNVQAAVPGQDSADGTEALNTEDALTFNTIASYIVVGAILLIVVILLAFAVCRSRRQKSNTPNEKDVENPGREMQDVNKPLINNRHSSAPEKQPLDETQQPLMTKEQEASLSMDPSEKTLLPLDADLKPKQNGSVPEVVVERSPAPVANGKAASPAGVRVPSPVVPAAPPPAQIVAPEAIAPKTTASPTSSPARSPPHSPTHSPTDGQANGSAVPLVNGGTHSPQRAPSPAPPPASSPAASQPPVSPGAVRVVAKELPDSVAKRPVIIVNRGAEPAQQV